MQKRSLVHLGMIAVLCVFCVSFAAHSQTQSAEQKGAATMHATGPFDVKLTPQDDKLDPALGRMIIDKQYHGDLEGTGKGTMLTGGTEQKRLVFTWQWKK
jgi:hypothetical protein